MPLTSLVDVEKVIGDIETNKVLLPNGTELSINLAKDSVRFLDGYKTVEITTKLSEEDSTKTVVKQLVFDKDKNTCCVSSLIINGKEIDVEDCNVEFSADGKTVKVTKASGTETFGYETVYSLEKAGGKNIGDVTSDIIKFPAGITPNSYTIDLTKESASFGSGYKTLEITTKLDGNNTITRQFNSSLNYTALSINNKSIEIDGCDVYFYTEKTPAADKLINDGIIANKAKSVQIVKPASDSSLGSEYTYSLVKDDDTAIGDITSYKLTSTSGVIDTKITKVLDLGFDADGGCTVKGEVAGTNVYEVYDKSGNLTGFKIAGADISIPKNAAITYNATAKTVTISSSSPKCTLVYNLTSGELKDTSTIFDGKSLNAGATVTFNKKDGNVESITVIEKGVNVNYTYNLSGDTIGMKIGNSEIDVTNASIEAVTNNTVTVTRTAAPAYSIVYDATTGKIKSGTYGSITLKENDEINEGSGYVAITNGNTLQLWDSATTLDYNEFFKLTPANYKKFITAIEKLNGLGAANKDNLGAVNLSNVKKDEILINGNTVSFSSQDKDIEVTLNNSNNIEKVEVYTQGKLLSEIDTNVDKTVIYNNGKLSTQYGFLGVTITSATAPYVSGQTITFGGASAPYIKVTVEEVTTGEGDAAVTKLQIKEIKYRTSTGTEDKDASTAAELEICADGDVRIK